MEQTKENYLYKQIRTIVVDDLCQKRSDFNRYLNGSEIKDLVINLYKNRILKSGDIDEVVKAQIIHTAKTDITINKNRMSKNMYPHLEYPHEVTYAVNNYDTEFNEEEKQVVENATREENNYYLQETFDNKRREYFTFLNG